MPQNTPAENPVTITIALPAKLAAALQFVSTLNDQTVEEYSFEAIKGNVIASLEGINNVGDEQVEAVLMEA